ncbi:MAG: chemotaxis response regulator protein-glutamate methylesterase [Sandaracinaceae bacterium]|nr:chemotaxis response regulator protein-glutamate methylesterase [Sandaracinaceae bacterium]
MSTRVRVLLADDSVVVRRALAKALESDPDFEVVATLANGVQALARLETTKVDAVVLDIEMPELDGLETLRRIRAKWPLLPVIMCSTLTERGATVTIEALSLGATDYVTKPAQASSYAEALAGLREELVRKIRAVVCPTRPSIRPLRTASAPPATPPPVVAAPPARQQRPEILAIGCSTGGPNALIDFWRGIPRTFPFPIVLVQHMPPVFTRMLAERLTALGGVPVKEGAEGERLEPGQARIAPGGFHMELFRQGELVKIHLHEGPPENSCRPAADVLFRSVARVYGPKAYGVVMTGMGQDALVGSRAIVDAGGAVLAQDEATSVVWGMPGFVARAGLAREVLPLAQLAPAVSRAFLGTAGRSDRMNPLLPPTKAA